MILQTVQIDLPSDILLTLNESEKELKERIRRSFAVHLYLTHKVTLGKAAQIAQMSRYGFECFLSENHIPISTLELNDVLKDMDKLK